MNKLFQLLTMFSVLILCGPAHATEELSPGACPHWSGLCQGYESHTDEQKAMQLKQFQSQAKELFMQVPGGVCCPVVHFPGCTEC
jgi:hypothetical protein